MSHCDRRYCTQCGGSWEDPREIPIVLFEENRRTYPTMEMAEAAAATFGWTKENKLHPGKDVVGIEYPYNCSEHYDGVSEWQCMLCGTRIGRWSGKALADDEREPRMEKGEDGRDGHQHP